MSDKENNKLKVEVGTTNDPTMIKKVIVNDAARDN